MGEMLSQAELDALLGNVMEDFGSSDTDGNVLSAEDQDILGEVGNINMGTAATTLFTLLSQKVHLIKAQEAIIATTTAHLVNQT
jgi:flagellar motor switch protein FliN/FliY